MSETKQESSAAPAAAAAGGQFDLEKAPVSDVLATLGVEPDRGLNGTEAEQRLKRYGPNALVEKEESLAAKILGHFMGPIAYMIEAAALVSAVIGHWDDFAIITTLLLFVQSFGLLLIGMAAVAHPQHHEWFHPATMAQLQSVMFLQLVAGGHLLLFITRNERWFVLPPFPAAPLFWAIVLTQVVAIVMCAAGWLVAPISWTLIGAVWGYNIAWMFLMGSVRLVTERFADQRTARHLKSVDVVNQALHPQAHAFAKSPVGRS